MSDNLENLDVDISKYMNIMFGEKEDNTENTTEQIRYNIYMDYNEFIPIFDISTKWTSLTFFIILGIKIGMSFIRYAVK